MTLTSILVTIVLILALYAKWKLIRVPKGYTFIGELDKPVEALAITNSPDDASSWKLLKPLEQRLPVPLEVFKIMEYDLALKKKEELQKIMMKMKALALFRLLTK